MDLTRGGSDDVRAQDLVGGFARDELDQTLGVVVGSGAGVGGEGEGADVVLGAGSLHILLRLSTPRNLRGRVVEPNNSYFHFRIEKYSLELKAASQLRHGRGRGRGGGAMSDENRSSY